MSGARNKSFFVWCPDDGDKPSEPNGYGFDPHHVAARWVEENHSSLDYPSECVVRVDDEAGRRFEIRVLAESTVSFRAESIT